MIQFSSTIKVTKGWQDILLTIGGVLLLFATSQVEIPMKPVPITLQTVGVMLIGLTYPVRLAVLSHLTWLGLAAIGLPVLSGFAGGVHHLIGNTAGYMVGFVVAVYIMATLKEKYHLKSFTSDALLCLLGTTVIFILGILWLAHLIGFNNAIMYGLIPFILPGLLKAGVLCAALQMIRR
jgi:biotin transport system substrate-specific component